MIWVVFALMTGAAMLALLWPLARAPRGTSNRESDVAFYQAQLREIDLDVERGLASPADAEGARAQAGRRLLSATQASGLIQKRSSTPKRVAAVLVLVFVPAATLGLYLHLGSPDFPDEPLSARLAAGPKKMDVGIAVARIEAHLAKDPNDGRGWAVIGPVYMGLGRPADAARAFSNAIKLLGDSATREEELGEALVAANDGQFNQAARQAFETALRLDPKSPAAEFSLGLAAEQVGDKAKALKIWTALLAQSPADAPWRSMVASRVAALGGTAPPPAAGPASSEAEAVAALPPAQRLAMIRGMVARLAAQLDKSGGEEADWERLVRAYSVLHEPDKARAALADARRNLAKDQNALARLGALAKQLGLES